MLRRVAAAILCLCICGWTTAAAVRQARAAESAPTIAVTGNRQIDADMIRAHFHAAADRSFDAAALDAALKSLYATGLFEDVKIARDGARIMVSVVEIQASPGWPSRATRRSKIKT
jgi:outer membrane protein assembly factor BamA